MKFREFNIIGVMSGTSLDGLDMAYCQFSYSDKWQYKILNTRHIPYTQNWSNTLSNIEKSSAIDINQLHIDFGKYIGQQLQSFIKEHRLSPDAIASHGHTIFHQPTKGLTLQIGDGAHIAAITDIKTICDFRTMDVALGGEGAPLVPVGDRLLFSEYDFCLNLGGIANISFEKDEKRIAYDICPCNMPINYLARTLGKTFDKAGLLGASGKVNEAMLHELNSLPYYKKTAPKSLGKEWVFETFMGIVGKFEINSIDKIRTIYEHIAFQIHLVTADMKKAKILISGGGAHNKFLIERIKKQSSHKINFPDDVTIDFKEALIFAFLGLLRLLGQNNVLASVTGASKDHCSGVIYG